MQTKLIMLISGLVGLILSLLFKIFLEISEVTFVFWIWVFILGLGAKILIQTFAVPFMNIPANKQVPGKQINNLNLLRSISICLGIGVLVGELIAYGNIGAISIALLILGTSIHVGTHYLNLRKWYFNQ